MTDQGRNFPVIFGRRGGENINILSHLKSNDTIQQIEVLSNIEIHIQEKKESILKELYQLIKANTIAEGKILNLKRDLYNDKNIEKYIKYISNEKLITSLRAYTFLKKTFKNSIEEFSNFYNEELYKTIPELESISNKCFLKNGLLFASRSLYNATEKKLLFSNQLNKKHKKHITSVLKYLSRSCTKTTPFSTFNTLFFLEKNNGANYTSNAEEIKYSHQLNNLILYYLEEALMEHQTFTECLQITVNQNIWKEKDFNFFINKKNNESLKKIQNTQILEYIFSKTQENKYTYKQLVTVITEVTQEPITTIKQYLNALLKEGFLILKFPVSPNQINWAFSLQKFLSNIKNDLTIFDPVIHTLKNIETYRKDLGTYTIQEKKIKIDLCYKSIIDAIRSLKKGSLCAQKMTPQDVFYEDVLLNINDTISESQYTKVCNDLKKTYDYFNKISYKHIVKRELSSFLKESTHDKIPLLEFYQHIYLKHINTVAIKEEDLEDLKNLLNHLNDHQKTIDTSEEIDLTDYIPKVISKHTGSKFGAYIQFTDQKKSKIILNNFSKSHGANSARFFNFCSQKIIDTIYNLNNEDTSIITDVQDASYHNLNVYPSLTQHTISICTDKKSNKKQTEIALINLYVSIDKEGNLSLVNKDDEKVIPLQFSLERLDRKSKFAQFLDLFDPADTFGYSLYLDKINTLFLNRLKDNTIVKVPRLYFGKDVIIQRKKWLVKKESLLHVMHNQKGSLAEIHYHVYHWLRKHKIPNEVFITIEAKGGNASKNNHKPQYINFEIPLHLLLLQDVLKNADQIITFTEMAPHSNDVLSTDGFVKEYIINT